jgi:hypothetical protein
MWNSSGTGNQEMLEWTEEKDRLTDRGDDCIWTDMINIMERPWNCCWRGVWREAAGWPTFYIVYLFSDWVVFIIVKNRSETRWRAAFDT